MLSIAAGTRIFVATGSTDMRKGFDGLQGIVTGALKQDPLSGHLFLFINRRRDKKSVISARSLSKRKLDMKRARSSSAKRSTRNNNRLPRSNTISNFFCSAFAARVRNESIRRKSCCFHSKSCSSCWPRPKSPNRPRLRKSN